MKRRSTMLLSGVLAFLCLLRAPAQAPTDAELDAIERQVEEQEKRKAEAAAEAEAKRKAEEARKKADAEARRKAAAAEAKRKADAAKAAARAEAERQAAEKAAEENRRPSDGGQASLAGELVDLPGGTFRMGCLAGDDHCDPDEHPAHAVTVPAFAIGRYEVTFEDYDRFAKDTKRELPDDSGFGRGRRPVINVRWDDAQSYAAWLSEKTGRRYRLPTESEWEYAARAGTATPYWWGDDIGQNRANCFDCGSEWDKKRTAPVGSFEPNPFGLHDTAGNVWEWVEDCWHGGYKGAPADGSAWREAGGGECGRRVVRGGPRSLRSALRGVVPAGDAIYYVGFRLARAL